LQIGLGKPHEALRGKSGYHQGHQTENQYVIFSISANVFREGIECKSPDNRSQEGAQPPITVMERMRNCCDKDGISGVMSRR